MSNNKPKASATKVLQVLQELQVTEQSNDFFIVGIGASAGGLSAFEAFFSGMPTDSDINMAFVLIQHLDPNHKSLLSELIQRYTSMKVYEIQNGMQVESNCVYIIPPNRNIKISYQTLHLLEPIAHRGHNLPIDVFFHSLAKERQSRAIGIILSGTGHDGTEGIKAIKEAGGRAIAQSVASCEFDGMPGSAIATGVIDDVLAPNEMPAQLLSYANGNFKKHTTTSPDTYDEQTLKKIFTLLQSQTSHDFSRYKSSTIKRRIERRLMLNKIDTLESYYKYLLQSENEVDSLFNDLLIGVTSFFRDKDVFLSLEKNIIWKLFSSRAADDAIRVWIPACSTGEEAYSIAILIMEQMQKLKRSFPVQIFATDIDPEAIAIARTGVYPPSISVDISKQRLERYFVKNSDDDTNDDNYRIHKNIRDMLIFSTHDVIKDPPFSNIDLISCRNLLIYMNIELQKKLISLFHYALNSNGFLLLGNSETLGELATEYSVLDAKSKLFQCDKTVENTRKSVINQLIPTNKLYAHIQAVKKVTPGVTLSLRELTQQAILKQVAPTAVLVNELGSCLFRS